MDFTPPNPHPHPFLEVFLSFILRQSFNYLYFFQLLRHFYEDAKEANFSMLGRRPGDCKPFQVNLWYFTCLSFISS